jgi:hypothetical protein
MMKNYIVNAVKTTVTYVDLTHCRAKGNSNRHIVTPKRHNDRAISEDAVAVTSSASTLLAPTRKFKPDQKNVDPGKS